MGDSCDSHHVDQLDPRIPRQDFSYPLPQWRWERFVRRLDHRIRLLALPHYERAAGHNPEPDASIIISRSVFR